MLDYVCLVHPFYIKVHSVFVKRFFVHDASEIKFGLFYLINPAFES